MTISNRVKEIFGILFFIAGSLTFSLVVTEDARSQQIHLNEVMASNSSTIADEDGTYGDWIEIYNSGENPISLEGYGLSDDYDRPFKWVFPDTTLDAGAFMLIWATNKDRTIPGSELHTNYAISADGEEVILTHPNGTIVDELEPTEIPMDISIGRKPDGTDDWVYFDKPTPGASNTTDPLGGILESPIFSHEPGFYSEEFELQISHPQDGVVVYYTLDGSEPTENSLIYEKPITVRDRNSEPNTISTIPTNFLEDFRRSAPPRTTIKKGTVLRTLSVKQGFKSNYSSKSYFVSPDGLNNHQLPVISIVTDNKNLFDDEIGIYVPGNLYEEGFQETGNYYGRGAEWEREGSLEFFEESGEFAFGQNVGIRIHGGYSRRLTQKSLRIYARNEYGDNAINYPIFPDQPYDAYRRLILRNSGNDQAFSLLRDAIAHRLVGHFNMETQAYRPSILYINGEYWGLHNIRERIDRHYLERKFDIDPERLELLSRHWTIEEGSNLDYAALLTFIQNQNLGHNPHYEYVKTKMDIDNYLDYFSAQIFFVNTDWPHNNIDFWRTRRSYNPDAPIGHDGRWRWLFYDLDFGLGLVEGPDFDMLNWVTQGKNYRNEEWPNQVLRNLLENESFKIDFINRMADHLNTAFLPERMVAVIREMKEVIEPEMQDYGNRWRYPRNVDIWNNTINYIIEWTQQRYVYHWQNIQDHFKISSTETVTIGVNDNSRGHVKINSIELTPETPGISENPYPWSGTYLSGIPVTVSAVAGEEYTFSHWEVDNHLFTSPTLTLLPDTTDSIQLFLEVVTESEPEVISLAEEDYLFDNFSADTPRGLYPEGMIFVYMNDTEPGLESEIEGAVTGSYNLSSRTRINGLGDGGFSFINTSNLEGNPGFPGRKLGGAVLYLNTADRSNIEIEWSAGTMEPNSRIYNIRLQYRVGSEGAFKNVLDVMGDPVEYKWNKEGGHEEVMGPVILPSEVEDQSHVEILWRYFFTGEIVDEESGQRSQLHISYISVRSKTLDYIVNPEPPDPERVVPNSFKLYQNFPNPYHPNTSIQYDLPKDQQVKLEIYSVTGQYIKTVINQPVAAGRHTVMIDASMLASGIYLYRLTTNEFTDTLRMSVIK